IFGSAPHLNSSLTHSPVTGSAGPMQAPLLQLLRDLQYFLDSVYQEDWSSGTVTNLFVFCVGLPVNCLAIYGLCRLVKSGMAVPVYVINLLVSDLLQLAVKPVLIARRLSPCPGLQLQRAYAASKMIHFFGLCGSIWFMVCIALERYLVVGRPLWYRSHRGLWRTGLVSLAVWAFTLAVGGLYVLGHLVVTVSEGAELLFLLIPYFLPFPLLVSSCAATGRALSGPGAGVVSARERRRVLQTLGLVLGGYAVLFLPRYLARWLLWAKGDSRPAQLFYRVTGELVGLNPLLDPVLYILVRKDVSSRL
uniref:G-protein coupled receptors family 1 profile domain-containing protein n=1 Tax=Lepisosteus oculatus TaxID=7918 RepID=W5LVV5_LEPOC